MILKLFIHAISQCSGLSAIRGPPLKWEWMNALRKLEHGFGLRPNIRVISRNIGLTPINHNENLFRISKLTIDILITFTFRAILTKLELLGKNRSKILLKNASKIMFLELKNMIFEAFLSKNFERFFKKISNFVKMTLNVKVINMSIVNLVVLNKFSFYYICIWGPNMDITSIPHLLLPEVFTFSDPLNLVLDSIRDKMIAA